MSTKITPASIAPESSAERRERKAEEYAASVADKGCCTKPSDWREGN
tara:strand:- start:350 stop:490 length:141 start_codon:yes stop_codon:yes gene_type:complete